MPDSSSESVRLATLNHRQGQVAELLAALHCEQLLILDRGNVHWFCGEPLTRGILDPADHPAIIVSAVHRFVVCSNVDSQRLFAVYLDNLGFQLKEWPWHLGREQLLAELTANKKLACDRLIEGAVSVADHCKCLRLFLDEPAKTKLRSLGVDVAHALEASARNISPGCAEREAAGHLGHRLLHRGIDPVEIHVAADGRLARDPRPAFTTAPINKYGTLFAVGHRDGLHAAAARTVVFGDKADAGQDDFDLALQIAAVRQAAMNVGVSPKDVFLAGHRVAQSAEMEHIWREHPIGFFVGWMPVERQLLPDATDLLQADQAQCWQVRVRSAWVADTVLQTTSGPIVVTSPEDWPVRRFQVGESVSTVADVLRR